VEIIESGGLTAEQTKFERAVDRMEGLETIPAVAQRLIALTSDPDAAFEDIEKVVSSDVALTARVLRLAASPLYGGHAPRGLQAAVVRIGLTEVRNLALSVSLLATPPDAFQRDLWQYSLTHAVLAEGLAKRLGAGRFREPFVCGLLHDLGTLVLAKMEGDLYHRLIGNIGAADQVEREQRVLGFTHCDIGALAAQRWNLFDGLEQVIQFHHDPLAAEALDFPPPVLGSVRLVALTSAALRPGSDDAGPEGVRLLLERLGATEETLTEELERVPSRVREYLEMLA
jgi:HD-like signal output (HDOD) protein